MLYADAFLSTRNPFDVERIYIRRMCVFRLSGFHGFVSSVYSMVVCSRLWLLCLTTALIRMFLYITRKVWGGKVVMVYSWAIGVCFV